MLTSIKDYGPLIQHVFSLDGSNWIIGTDPIGVELSTLDDTLIMSGGVMTWRSFVHSWLFVRKIMLPHTCRGASF